MWNKLNPSPVKSKKTEMNESELNKKNFLVKSDYLNYAEVVSYGNAELKIKNQIRFAMEVLIWNVIYVKHSIYLTSVPRASDGHLWIRWQGFRESNVLFDNGLIPCDTLLLVWRFVYHQQSDASHNKLWADRLIVLSTRNRCPCSPYFGTHSYLRQNHQKGGWDWENCLQNDAV